MTKPQMQSEPKPPFSKQHQASVGLESKLDPRPRFEAPRYKPAGKLEGKAALITGGDSGIGRAVAVMYAREGADVAIGYLPEEQSDAEETRRHVEAAGRRCALLPGDLTDAAYCDSLVEKTVTGESHLIDRIGLVTATATEQWTAPTELSGTYQVVAYRTGTPELSAVTEIRLP